MMIVLTAPSHEAVCVLLTNLLNFLLCTLRMFFYVFRQDQSLAVAERPCDAPCRC